ncbi:MAG: hypothetical protein PHC89_02780 [Candidatus Pacebacteria bacterium]|nr:hypothetical protein [Candidatus Paceibacterota bacterium]
MDEKTLLKEKTLAPCEFCTGTGNIPQEDTLHYPCSRCAGTGKNIKTVSIEELRRLQKYNEKNGNELISLHLGEKIKYKEKYE